jgi:acyl-CoA thioester hydrolase
MIDLPFTVPLAIAPSDIDELGHVNNATYVRWTQYAVVEHWKHYATAAIQARYWWIAIRHEIDYCREAFLEDDIVAEVTLRQAKSVRVMYETSIMRNGTTLTKARSIWCCIDPQSRRPKKLGPDIIAAFGLQNTTHMPVSSINL